MKMVLNNTDNENIAEDSRYQRCDTEVAAWTKFAGMQVVRLACVDGRGSSQDVNGAAENLAGGPRMQDDLARM